VSPPHPLEWQLTHVVLGVAPDAWQIEHPPEPSWTLACTTETSSMLWHACPSSPLQP